MTSHAIPVLLAGVVASSLLVPVSASAEEDRLTPPLVFTGSVGEGLWAYGQVNKGLLIHDDGQAIVAYPLVDNANSSTRGGLWFRTRAADDFVFSFNTEAEWNPYSTGRVNRRNDDYVDWSQWRLRKAEAIFDVDGVGTIWAGQGSTASDGAAEQDLSGTSLIAYSSVADSASGQLYVTDAGVLTGLPIGATFVNLDGLGRLARVRYDTPRWRGLSLRASAGSDALDAFGTLRDDPQWDVAADYARTGERFQTAARAAFARVDSSRNRVSGSASILHLATGLSATISAGSQEDTAGRDPRFGYLKLGWRGDLTDLGETAVSADVYAGEDAGAPNSNSISFGIAAVQNVPAWQTEFYAGLRWYDYDDPGASYESALSFLTGARFRF